MQLAMNFDAPAPAARRRDPETSHQAAAQAKELAARHHRVILYVLREHGPRGKDGIAKLAMLEGVQVARRLSELHKAGKVVPTGATVQSDTGRGEREWRLC